MSIVDIYLAYAAAFEETFVDDDWSRLERFFAEDVGVSRRRRYRGEWP